MANTTSAKWVPDVDPFALAVNATQGLVLLVMNTAIVAVILFQGMLRQQKEYIIMGGLAFTDVLVGLALFVSGIMRSILLYNGTAFILTTKWACFWTPWNIIFNWATPSASYMLLLVSIDRLYAVYRPLSYFMRTTSYAWKIFLGLMVVVGMHVLVAGTITYNSKRVPVSPSYCFPSHGVDADWYNDCISLGKLIAPLISVLLYFFIARRVRQHIVSVRGLNETDLARKMQNLRQFTITLGISSLFTAIVHVLPLTYTTFLVPVFGAPTFTTLTHIAKTSANMNPVFNIIVLVVRQKELRSGFRLMWKGKQMQPNSWTGHANKSSNAKH
uniref:G-protein coupled receptors family 1 profile domain-containing protein n=1 Tax=Plectus sambesii TaxID=2011161 RepID=A0A914VWC5_9BILA